MLTTLLITTALLAQPAAPPSTPGDRAATATAVAAQRESDRVFSITVSFLFADVELGPDDDNLRVHRPDDEPDPSARPTLHFAGEDDHRVDDDRWYLRLGESHSISGRKEDPMVEFATAISSPRFLIREGDDAKVYVGGDTPYLERREDGAFELRRRKDLSEGVMVDVLGPRLTDKGVAFERLTMRISEVVGREKVEGLPFDAGPPIVQSTEVSFAPTIPHDRVAFVRVPGFVHEEGLLYLAIRVVEEAGDE